MKNKKLNIILLLLIAFSILIIVNTIGESDNYEGYNALFIGGGRL